MAKYCGFLRKFPLSISPTVRCFCSSIENSPKSSLFISGKRAQDTFVVVIPHLDFDERFQNLTDLKKNIEQRKLNLNVEELKNSWEFYKDWISKKNKLSDNLDETGRRIKELYKREEHEGKTKEIENLERFRNILKSDLNEVKQNVWGLEDNVVGNLLLLPNILHPEAPGKDEDIFLFEEEDTFKGVNHLAAGDNLNILEYYNKYICFLKNKAAIFELAAAEFFTHCFVEKGFLLFSNPDFTRSALAEGVGVPPNDMSELFLLENVEGNNDPLHLCGGASLFPFCGFHAKQVVHQRSLPVRYVTSGRRYSPTTSPLPGLYSVHQTTSVQVFIATSSNEQLYNEFQNCLKNIESIFIDLKLKFRIVKQSPSSYKNWESLRVSIQVFSPFNESFIEVGHLSLIDEFISKRLRMCYSDKKGELFLKVVSGSIVSVQTLLALCLERSNKELFTPEVLKQFMPHNW